MTTQTMPKDAQESGGPPAMMGTEGRQGSAGSNEGGSKDQSSGEAETASEPQPPSMQQQVPFSPLSTYPKGRKAIYFVPSARRAFLADAVRS